MKIDRIYKSTNRCQNDCDCAAPPPSHHSDEKRYGEFIWQWEWHAARWNGTARSVQLSQLGLQLQHFTASWTASHSRMPLSQERHGRRWFRNSLFLLHILPSSSAAVSEVEELHHLFFRPGTVPKRQGKNSRKLIETDLPSALPFLLAWRQTTLNCSSVWQSERRRSLPALSPNWISAVARIAEQRHKHCISGTTQRNADRFRFLGGERLFWKAGKLRCLRRGPCHLTALCMNSIVETSVISFVLLQELWRPRLARRWAELADKEAFILKLRKVLPTPWVTT